MILVSVIIPSYNPDRSRLSKVIEGLKSQTFSKVNWELILVDNNSDNGVIQSEYQSEIKNSTVIQEQKQGLTFARLKGFIEAKGHIIIMVDDDNILADNYLQLAFNTMESNPDLGALGGKSIPLFEEKPPEWLHHFYDSLALRDLGNEMQVKRWENNYPNIAPIGAGMIIRKKALKSYIDNILESSKTITDRTPTSLGSGGDNEIIITILKDGWEIAYLPELSLRHIIPAERMEQAYLAKLAYATNKSWIILLEKYHITPWSKIPSWTVKFRKAKSWFEHKAWKNEINFIKWQASCGIFDGLSK